MAEAQGQKTLIFCLFLMCLFVCVFSQSHYGFRNIPGQFCRTEIGNRCCDGRVDECSFPILGTRCYCDQFCNRTINPDCCPDYWNTCLGLFVPLESPGTLIQPFACKFNDQELLPLKVEKKDNCNTCKCVSISEGLKCTEDICMVDETFLEKVKMRAHLTGWTARNYTRFWGKKLDDGLHMLTGTLQPSKSSLRIHPIHLHYDANLLPKHFDARSRWPWAEIGKIWDQGWCGASWAFSTASVAEDRLAIESGGKEVVKFSRQNLLSCNRKGQQACKGGHVDRAWNYLRRYGVVTDSCFPYISGEKGLTGDCKLSKKGNLLSTSCPRDSFPMGRKELYKTEPPYRISSNEEDIMWEVMTTGPVQAIIKVYRDFFLYGSGIYSRDGLPHDSKFAHHSIKILGWGEEPTPYGGAPQKYWLCQNSWGDSWGERGLFRIRRAVNETDIEHFIITSRARLADKRYDKGHPALTRRRRHRSRHNDNRVTD